MITGVDFVGYDKDDDTIEVVEVSQCPLCATAMRPVFLSAAYFTDSNDYDIGVCVCLCTNCESPFFVQYCLDDASPEPRIIAPRNYQDHSFCSELEELSPKFVSIFNQAAKAEADDLNEISGMAYRKALEFLIKDYLIHVKPDEKDTIERMELHNCIANKIDDENIKATAQGATWLGNDFTHYKRHYDEYELEDLKSFIEASAHWVAMALITEKARAFRDQNRGQTPGRRQREAPRPVTNIE